MAPTDGCTASVKSGDPQAGERVEARGRPKASQTGHYDAGNGACRPGPEGVQTMRLGLKRAGARPDRTGSVI